MNTILISFLTYLKNKYESLSDNEDDRIRKEVLKENMIIFESFLKDKTLEEHTLTYVAIISLIKKEILNFFNVSFINKDVLSSTSLTFPDARLEALVDRIYKHVLKNM